MNQDNSDDFIIEIEDKEERETQDTTFMNEEANKNQNEPRENKNDSETIKPDFKSMIFEKLGVATSTNPSVCISHLIFKALAISTYILGGWFFNSITIFIFVSIFGVLDFWVVKNITGRILAGLRWWRVIDEEGKEKWIFESHDEDLKNNKIDGIFFWYGQIFATVFWILMTFVKILTLSPFWVILSSASLSLTGINLYAYYMCRKDYKNKLNNVLGGSMNMGGIVMDTIKAKFGFNN